MPHDELKVHDMRRIARITGKKLVSDRKTRNHQWEDGMTRTDVVASSRPQRADAAPTAKGPRKALRRLSLLPVAFVLTMALGLPTAAFAAEGLSGYSTTPKTTSTTTPTPTTSTTTPTPTTSTPTSPTPTTGTSPSKESSTPEKATAPEKASEPTSTTVAKKATSLPFTGFDFRWTIAAGFLLVAMGGSIVIVQRRQRRRDSL
jgi:cytoskeletal protein RodZ